MKVNIFHLLNRGVEKRKVFITKEDYLRFAYNLYDFNDTENVTLRYFYRRKPVPSFAEVRRLQKPKRELVDILCWCLMPNHPHALVCEKIKGGASKFSQKIIGGYTRYFNDKNKRDGVLFQGRSKIIKVTKEPHFIHLPFYIMANPIDLIESDWRERGIQNLDKVIRFLENYKNSSFLDLIGKENFSFMINKKLFYDLFQTDEKEFKKHFIGWLKTYKGDTGFSKFE